MCSVGAGAASEDEGILILASSTRRGRAAKLDVVAVDHVVARPHAVLFPARCGARGR